MYRFLALSLMVAALPLSAGAAENNAGGIGTVGGLGAVGGVTSAGIAGHTFKKNTDASEPGIIDPSHYAGLSQQLGDSDSSPLILLSATMQEPSLNAPASERQYRYHFQAAHEGTVTIEYREMIPNKKGLNQEPTVKKHSFIFQVGEAPKIKDIHVIYLKIDQTYDLVLPAGSSESTGHVYSWDLGS